MLRVLSAIIKIGLASLATGVVLSALNISAAELLAEIGLTPENVFAASPAGRGLGHSQHRARFDGDRADLARDLSAAAATQLSPRHGVGNRELVSRRPAHRADA
jgi:hypothetical protein